MEHLLKHDLLEKDEENVQSMGEDNSDDEEEVQTKCERPECNFQKHSWQNHNYCCYKCFQKGGHGDFCEKFP